MIRRDHFYAHVLALLATLALWVGAAIASEQEGGHHDDEHRVGSDEEMPGAVQFTVAQRQALKITSEAAGPARIAVELRLVGEVALNLDRTAHVTSPVPGVVTRIDRSFGSHVEAGERLAVLDSRDLAELRARFFTAVARERLLLTTFAREETLWQEKISSEREYLTSGQALEEARIARSAAEQMLFALGVDPAKLEALPEDGGIARYELTAPIGGTVVDRHVTIGEMLADTDPAFLISDLDTVWVELAVYLHDLYRLGQGQPVRVQAGDTGPRSHGTISYLSALVNQSTRTTQARVELANEDGRWRPGTPVSAWVTVSALEAAVTVPNSAVYEIEGETHVFVDGGDGISPRPVTVGVRDSERTSIIIGLTASEYVIGSGGVHVKAAFLGAGVGGHDH